MSELRDRIAEALYVHNARELGFGVPDHKGRTAVPWERLPAGAKESWYPRADAILAIPGIAVVELPEPDYDGDDGGVGWGTSDNSVFTSGGMVYDQGSELSPAQAREIGSWWLAAAEHAEREQ